MYASPVMVYPESSGSTARLLAVLSIICRRARAGAGIVFTPDHCISVFGLARAEALPLQRLCHSKVDGLQSCIKHTAESESVVCNQQPSPEILGPDYSLGADSCPRNEVSLHQCMTRVPTNSPYLIRSEAC